MFHMGYGFVDDLFAGYKIIVKDNVQGAIHHETKAQNRRQIHIWL